MRDWRHRTSSIKNTIAPVECFCMTIENGQLFEFIITCWDSGQLLNLLGWTQLAVHTHTQQRRIHAGSVKRGGRESKFLDAAPENNKNRPKKQKSAKKGGRGRFGPLPLDPPLHKVCENLHNYLKEADSTRRRRIRRSKLVRTKNKLRVTGPLRHDSIHELLLISLSINDVSDWSKRFTESRNHRNRPIKIVLL